MAQRQNTTLLKKQMIEALTKSLGVVTTACKHVKIARSTHYTRMDEDEEYNKEVTSIEDVALDFAESKLHSRIQNDDTTATIFYLKTKGKRRGYIEKVENDVNVKQDKPFVIELSDGVDYEADTKTD